MRYLIGTIAVLACVAPLTVSAQGLSLTDLNSFISGVVQSATVASSSSGGVVVTGGASSTGDASASSFVRTFMRSDGGNTTVEIETRTESDDEVKTQSVFRSLRRGERADVSVATSSEGASARGSVRMFGNASTSAPHLFSFFNWFGNASDEETTETEVETEAGTSIEVEADVRGFWQRFLDALRRAWN